MKKIVYRVEIASFWRAFYQFSAMKTQISIFVPFGVIEELRKKKIPEMKWNYAKRASQRLHMLREAMLYHMKGEIV